MHELRSINSVTQAQKKTRVARVADCYASSLRTFPGITSFFGGLAVVECRLKDHSHCAFFSDCECDLFLLVMGQNGADDVVTVAQCEHFH